MPQKRPISSAARAGLIQRLAGICVALLLALQLLFPAAGAAAADGQWIEICGESGVALIQVNAETGEAQQDCPDCSTCVLCAAETGAKPVNCPPAASRAAAAPALPLPAQALVRPNPAQYWHEGRGPPLAKKIATERALRASMEATLTEGEAPWA